MAKLIYSAITSLDGYVADADGNFVVDLTDAQLASLRALNLGAALGAEPAQPDGGSAGLATRAGHRHGQRDCARCARAFASAVCAVM